MKAVFLDRDGVINEKIENGYVLDWKDFRFIPGAVEGIRMLNERGIPVYVVSNQACIGKGLITKRKLDDINKMMMKELGKQGARIDDIFVCPHTQEDNCDCRKPRPGLLLKAAKKHKIDLNGSWFVGDSGSDAEAGKAAGCRFYLIKDGADLKTAVRNIIGEAQ